MKLRNTVRAFAAGRVHALDRAPAFTDSAIASTSIISQTAGPARSWKRRTVSMPLLMMSSWAAQTPRQHSYDGSGLNTQKWHLPL
ncbi:hypothetical protein [Streptomyces sp. S.PB5]|uniref:hypothetical protein n=1 Tax=Streptomyces sp. S.PB5 TaxID=3020844 RepID=UPI0025B1BA32|nr:hypothetical protein [Streptomyces sp. S.PB5]MDN3027067.1 hypothetical protein [Streptomyces sp. S.PB5]